MWNNNLTRNLLLIKSLIVVIDDDGGGGGVGVFSVCVHCVCSVCVCVCLFVLCVCVCVCVHVCASNLISHNFTKNTNQKNLHSHLGLGLKFIPTPTLTNSWTCLKQQSYDCLTLSISVSTLLAKTLQRH